MRLILILAGLNALAALMAAIPAAAQPTGMGHDPKYWAFIQELKRASTVASGTEAAAIVDALRKKNIRVQVHGIEKDDPSPRVVISIGVFEPTPITPELVNSLPKEIAGFPVVVERPCCFVGLPGVLRLDSSRRTLK
jgi:hypothetical protein